MLEITYPAEVWSVMPSIGSGDEEAWVAGQVALAEEFGGAKAAALVARAAPEALIFRRNGIDTSLFFHPFSIEGTGVLHVTVAGLDAPDGALDAADWIPDGLDPAFEPIVSEFETDHSPHGFRVAYLSAHRAEDGRPLAGISYGLQLDGGIATVFSELADTEIAGLMQLHADPLVGSLRLVR